jgi:hypothetical protein
MFLQKNRVGRLPEGGQTSRHPGRVEPSQKPFSPEQLEAKLKK